MDGKNIIIIHVNQHYIGLYISPYNDGSVFVDSINNAIKSYSKLLDEFVLFYSPRIRSLPFRVQSQQSELCAAYVLYFMHNLADNKKLQQTCDVFKSGDYRANDVKLRSWFRAKFPYNVWSVLFK